MLEGGIHFEGLGSVGGLFVLMEAVSALRGGVGRGGEVGEVLNARMEGLLR
jgi:hypothetical protein